MLFNSVEFIFLFLPIVLLGTRLASCLSVNAVIWWLAFASLAFYSVWNVAFLPVLVGSIILNFMASVFIDRSRQRPRLQSWILFAAISANLLALSYFKYLFPLLGWFQSAGIFHSPVPSVILPLGISFFTFTQIGYLVDLKEGEANREPLRNYLFFVTFFPHLIAGPILHHREIMPQLAESRRFRLNADDVASGLTLFVIGLFKKIIFADQIAVFAKPLFEGSGNVFALTSWAGMVCYGLQLYFDFSGYSDMAVGLARMLSIRFPVNFNSPFKATSVIDYWQRWHMTLTRYITMYLYNPMSLAIARRQTQSGIKLRIKKISPKIFASRIAVPTLVAMFLAGIWHGAGLQFIIFGLLHGFYLAVNHAWRSFAGPLRRAVAGPAWISAALSPVLTKILVFVPVLVAWVFFRAVDTAQALNILRSMSGFHGLETLAPWARAHSSELKHIAVLLVIVFACPNSQQIIGYSPGREIDEATPVFQFSRWSLAWRPGLAYGVLLAVVFAYALIRMSRNSEFLYFQF